MISHPANLLKVIECLVQRWIVDVDKISQNVIAADKIEWRNGHRADFYTGNQFNGCGDGETKRLF